jgi:hypothetical protein
MFLSDSLGIKNAAENLGPRLRHAVRLGKLLLALPKKEQVHN